MELEQQQNDENNVEVHAVAIDMKLDGQQQQQGGGLANNEDANSPPPFPQQQQQHGNNLNKQHNQLNQNLQNVGFELQNVLRGQQQAEQQWQQQQQAEWPQQQLGGVGNADGVAAGAVVPFVLQEMMAAKMMDGGGNIFPFPPDPAHDGSGKINDNDDNFNLDDVPEID